MGFLHNLLVVLLGAVSGTFITVWRTQQDETSITLPMISIGKYDFSVDWGDGTASETVLVVPPQSFDSKSHTYLSAGDYVVTITGQFEGFNLRLNQAEALKIIEIRQWGNGFRFGSFNSQFKNCGNLIVTASDAPILDKTTDLSGMFGRCTSLNNLTSISTWDTSKVTDMSGMFSETDYFNADIGAWDTSSVTDMSNMFIETRSFNADISAWDTSSVTAMSMMFKRARSFKADIGAWDTSSVTDMSEMFENTRYEGDTSAWDVASVSSCLSFCGSCPLPKFPPCNPCCRVCPQGTPKHICETIFSCTDTITPVYNVAGQEVCQCPRGQEPPPPPPPPTPPGICIMSPTDSPTAAPTLPPTLPTPKPTRSPVAAPPTYSPSTASPTVSPTESGHWVYDNVGECSASCGSGFYTRRVECENQGPLSAGCQMPAPSGVVPCQVGDCPRIEANCPRGTHGTTCEQEVVLSNLTINGALTGFYPWVAACVDCPVMFMWTITGASRATDDEALVSISLVDSAGDVSILGDSVGSNQAQVFDLVSLGVSPGRYTAHLSLSANIFAVPFSFDFDDACRYLDCDQHAAASTCDAGVCQCANGYTGLQCEVPPPDPCALQCVDAGSTERLRQELELFDAAIMDDLGDCEKCKLSTEVVTLKAKTNKQRNGWSLAKLLNFNKGNANVKADDICKQSVKLAQKELDKKLDSGVDGGIAWIRSNVVNCVPLPDQSSSEETVTKLTVQTTYEYAKQAEELTVQTTYEYAEQAEGTQQLAPGTMEREVIEMELLKYLTDEAGDYQNDPVVGGSRFITLSESPTLAPSVSPTTAGPITALPTTIPTALPTAKPTTAFPTSSPTPFGQRSIVCEIDTAVLECKRGTIKIKQSTLGREDEVAAGNFDECPETRGTCGERRDVINKVSGDCDGRTRCKLYVGLEDLGVLDDPCPGVAKYLSTYFTCVDPDTGREITESPRPPTVAGAPNTFASVCVNSRLELQCDGDLVITEVKATFGRSRGNSARCAASDETCDAVDVSSYYAERCLGVASCSVRVQRAGVCQTGYLLSGTYTCDTELNALKVDAEGGLFA